MDRASGVSDSDDDRTGSGQARYALPTWTRTVALVAEHWRLQRIFGCEGDPPSKWSAYRFAAKLRKHDKLARCIDSVVEGLKAKLPTYGRDLAIDASDMPAYANGQRFVRKDSEVERNWHIDPGGSWGHRSAVSTRRGGGSELGIRPDMS